MKINNEKESHFELTLRKYQIFVECMECDCHICLKYLVFPIKNLVFQAKNLSF